MVKTFRGGSDTSKDTPEYKRCPGCGQTKASDEFDKSRAQYDGLQAYCKPCKKKDRKKRDKKRIVVVIDHKKCSNCGEIKLASEFHRSNNDVSGLFSSCKKCVSLHGKRTYSYDVKRRYRLKKYGITEEEYGYLYNLQYGKCGICGIEERVLCIDHDHITGKVRGLLCKKCNRSIGLLGDTVESAQRVVKYLQASEKIWLGEN